MKDKRGKHERSAEVMFPASGTLRCSGFRQKPRGCGTEKKPDGVTARCCTHRTRKALRPRKAPSVMWLMVLWPRRRLWSSPSTDRLPSSRRVRLLYDRFLQGGRSPWQTWRRRREGKKTVVCEVWKETIGCHKSREECSTTIHTSNDVICFLTQTQNLHYPQNSLIFLLKNNKISQLIKAGGPSSYPLAVCFCEQALGVLDQSCVHRPTPPPEPIWNAITASS